VTLAFGDLQGCRQPLEQLLKKIGAAPTEPLWFCGDLVNRGPDSLGTLRQIRQLGLRARTVLGNHDLHLLAQYAGIRTPRPGDTLEPILRAPDAPAASLHDRLMTLGSATLLRTLPDVLAQTRQPTPQAADGITYAHKLNKAEARLDWHAPVATLDRKIRAYNPTPIAHTTLDGEALRIHAAHVLNHHPAAAPGTITAHHADGLDVACADGTLRITRLQLPGKTATDAAALRHSRDLTGPLLH